MARSTRRTQLIILRLLLVDAAGALRARRMQALLSAFGIATGIAAVVLLVSLVSGVHRMALQQFNTRGGNVVLVTVGQQTSAEAPTGTPLTLTSDDADAVVRASPFFDRGAAENGASVVVRGVETPSGGPVMILMGPGGTPSFFNFNRAFQIQITGLTQAGFELQNPALAAGRLPAREELDRGDRVIVLGAWVAQQIFGGKNGVGETIVLGDWPFQVLGVMAWVGEPSGEFRSPLDRAAYAPFSTVGGLFRGNSTATRLSLRLTESGLEERAVADARGILSRRLTRLGHTSGELEFSSAMDRVRELGLVLSGLKLLVGLVGGIGLFVGAVGVANVLLVSVRERTAEIGIRRAIGARRQHIFAGFLFESLAITLGGGLIGILAAWTLTKIAAFLPIPDGAEPHMSLVTAAVAVLLLVVVGLVSGVGPARRAAAVYPVEALRAE
jgi:putative ABC transport system permease protein